MTSAALSDRDRLFAQYHMLKAMAIKLDAGVATDGEIFAFHRALAEYDALYDRLKNGTQALSTSTQDSRAIGPEANNWWALI